MFERHSLLPEVASDDNLLRAWRHVRGNVPVAWRPLSRGVDGVSIASFDRACEQELARLADDLLAGSYSPAPVRWIQIPKPAGGQRTIGILSVRDRVAQRATHQVLDPRLDDVFLGCSFGFRQGRSARDALDALTAYGRAGDTWALVADIEDCFNQLDHAILLTALRRHFGDEDLLQLVRSWLETGMIGRPQGLDRPPVSQIAPDSGASRQDGPLGRIAGTARNVQSMLVPTHYDFPDYAAPRRTPVGTDLLLTGVSLAGPVLNQARRAWPLVHRAFHGKAAILGGVGLALLVAAPLVGRALNRPVDACGNGVLQGSSLSPLLANLYLHDFDMALCQSGYHLVRYADDFVISCPHESVAREARRTCSEVLEQLKLRVNAEKSTLVQWAHGFEFLGVKLVGPNGGPRWQHSI